MKTPALLLAMISLTASSAWADGEVIFDVAGNTDDESGSLARGSDGRLYVQTSAYYSASSSEGEAHIVAFEPNGQLSTAFGTNGKVPSHGGPIAVRSDGSIINGSFTTGTYSSTGAPLASFSVCGVFYPCTSTRVFASTFFPLPNGSSFTGGGEVFRVFQSSYWTLVRVNADGSKDTAFAGNPDGWVQKDGGPSTEIVAMKAQTTNQILVLGWNSISGALALSRFNLDGGTDFSFGTNGVLAIGTSAVFASPGTVNLYTARNIPLGVDSAQRILVPADGVLAERRSPNGLPDASYIPVAPEPQTTYLKFVVDSLDRVLVFGQRNGAAYVARLLPGGGLDPAFGTGGEFTYTSESGASGLVLSDALLDADRPILFFSVDGLNGHRDIGLARLTTAGTLDTSFATGVEDADVYPDAITIASNTAPFGTTGVVSSPLTITGINAPTNVQLTNLLIPSTQGFSVGCTGTYSQRERVLILPNQTLCVRHDASTTAGASVATTLNVGGRALSYTTTSTATPSDITPNAFAFTDQVDVTPGTQVISGPITVTGITGAAPIAIDFGQYSVGCDGNFNSSAGTVASGQTVCVRVTAPASFSTSVSATLAINGVTDTFTATTVASDTTPTAFTFTSVGNVSQAASVMSLPTTIGGINTAAPVTVSGGRYSINCSAAALTDQPGTITTGQNLCVEHTSASSPGTPVTTTVTVGSYSTTFTSTTAASIGGGSSSSGGGGGSMSPRDLLALAIALLFLRAWPAFRSRKPAASTPTS